MKFCRFDLRTTNAVDATRAFYERILGHDRATIWPLHEQAVARGAKPHWLGRIGVDDVERTIAAFVERGAQQLGSTRTMSDEGQSATLRDPGGALVAIGTPPSLDIEIGVVWHVLNTHDAAQATKNYVELFGWQLGEPIAAGEQGVFRSFSWQAGGANAGAIGDIAGRAGVHPQWLFFFEVASLDDTIAFVRASSGLAFDPITLPTGERISVCEDPQGAAFALRERS